MNHLPSAGVPPREPAFNLPRAVTAVIAALIAVQALRSLPLQGLQTELLLWLAFIPARYSGEVPFDFPGGTAASLWTFLTYALLHGDWFHLAVNTVWLAAFGAGLARRFGSARFLAFSAGCAAAGAGAHLVSHWGEFVPMVGASAAVSGQMAAAARYAFRFGGIAGRGDEACRGPALPLREVVRDPRVVTFLALWFLLNLAFGTGLVPLSLDDPQIAWQAHIGGFVFGLLGFAPFDPVRPRPFRASS